MGSVSEIQWLRSLQREIATPGSEPLEQPYGPAGPGNAAIAQRSEALHARQKSRKYVYCQPNTAPEIVPKKMTLKSSTLRTHSLVVNRRLLFLYIVGRVPLGRSTRRPFI